MRKPEFYFKQLDTKLKHMCPGTMLGVRMALCGCKLVGLDPARAEDRKNLIVFLEMDRCASDSISLVTGCTLGRRTLKYFDYGILAASFLNLKTNAAARVIAKESPREIATAKENKESILQAYASAADESLFIIQTDITIDIDFYQLPGMPKKQVPCDACGVMVNDNKQIAEGEKLLCKPCAGAGYWKRKEGQGNEKT